MLFLSLENKWISFSASFLFLRIFCFDGLCAMEIARGVMAPEIIIKYLEEAQNFAFNLRLQVATEKAAFEKIAERYKNLYQPKYNELYFQYYNELFKNNQLWSLESLLAINVRSADDLNRKINLLQNKGMSYRQEIHYANLLIDFYKENISPLGFPIETTNKIGYANKISNDMHRCSVCQKSATIETNKKAYEIRTLRKQAHTMREKVESNLLLHKNDRGEYGKICNNYKTAQKDSDHYFNEKPLDMIINIETRSYSELKLKFDYMNNIIHAYEKEVRYAQQLVGSK